MNLYSILQFGSPGQANMCGYARLPPGGPAPRESRDAVPAACVREARGSAGQRMSKVYGEPVEVQTREDGRPVRFAWRGRLYTVIAVQEHWMVNRDWWREAAPVPAHPELQFWRVEASTGQGS